MSHSNGTAPPLKATPRKVRQPRQPRPSRRLPLEALPERIRDLAQAGSEALGCDPAYIALPALAAAAAAIGNARHLMLKQSWQEPPVLWTAVIGDSGTLKTPAYRLAMRPLWQAQAGWMQEHRQALRGHEQALEAYRERCRGRQGERPEPPLRPVPRRVTCSDVTIERLAELLEDSPKGILVARDELAGWLGSFTRYKTQGTDLPNWLELYQSGTVIVDRKTADRKSIVIRHASASITGGIQPGTLARCLKEEHFEAGLVARLLMAWPARRPKRWTEADVSPCVLKAYADMIDWLLALTMRQSDDGPVPHRLALTGHARELWVDWYDLWAREQELAEGDVAACYSKIEAAAARLALVHHCSTLAGQEAEDLRDVLPESMEAGIKLARWFAGEAARAYDLVRASDEDREAGRLLEWARRQGGPVTASQLKRANPSRYPDGETAALALQSLATGGLGTWTVRPPSERGGRPTEEFLPGADCRNPETAETSETSETQAEMSVNGGHGGG